LQVSCLLDQVFSCALLYNTNILKTLSYTQRTCTSEARNITQGIRKEQPIINVFHVKRFSKIIEICTTDDPHISMKQKDN